MFPISLIFINRSKSILESSTAVSPVPRVGEVITYPSGKDVIGTQITGVQYVYKENGTRTKVLVYCKDV